MCGIAGFNIADGDFKVIDSQQLAKSLLMEIVTRGRHATGMAWTQRSAEDGKIPEGYYAKSPVPATAFLGTVNKHLPRFSRHVIRHTRYATQGSPKVTENNHPIVIPGIVGVHNGHISNDDQIIADRKATRLGEVDSEAAFHLIDSSKDVSKDLGELQGRAALAWLEVRNPRTLHLARVSDSPLAIGQTPAGSVIFASTAYLLEKACESAKVEIDFVTELDELTYLKVSNGIIHDWRDIESHRKPASLGFKGAGKRMLWE